MNFIDSLSLANKILFYTFYSLNFFLNYSKHIKYCVERMIQIFLMITNLNSL